MMLKVVTVVILEPYKNVEFVGYFGNVFAHKS